MIKEKQIDIHIFIPCIFEKKIPTSFQCY